MRIKIPVYNQPVYIENNYDGNDFKAIVEFNPIKLRYNPKYWDIKTLAHECIHIINRICKNCLIDLNDYDNDEWYAYLYADIFHRIYNATKKDLIK